MMTVLAVISIFLPEENKHLVSFAATDSFLVLDGQAGYWLDGSSNEKMEFLKGSIRPSGEYIIFEPNHDSGKYDWLLHDPYRRLILRHVSIRPAKNEKEEIAYFYNSFVVLNEKLEKVKELHFKSNQFGGMGFVTPNGFYLPLANQESDDEVAYARINL